MMLSTKKLALFAFSFVITTNLSLQPAHATLEIVAKVNGKAITNFDVDQRAKFLRLITNLENSEENRVQIKYDAKQMLIDEILKLQAAKNIDSNIKIQSRKRARDIVNKNFSREGMDGIENLRKNGIEVLKIQKKFMTEILWAEFIKTKFRNKFDNINSTVDKVIMKIKKNAEQPQVKLSEIILLPEPNRPMQKTLALANEIFKAVEGGASFSAIAKQYSSAGTARSGGALGWALISQLPKDIKNHVEKIDVGEVGVPLQRDGLVILIRKEGTRENGVADPGQDIITLTRALFPLANNASNADKLVAAARLERDTETIKTCNGLTTLNQSYNSGINGLIEDVTLSSFSTPLKRMINELDLLIPSKPLSFIEGVSVFMLCKRTSPKIALPARKEVFRNEFDKIFGSLSESYLMRLRRSAIIETDI
ncbi:peptidylprolyl isomerase [Candidatus Puniceispirillum sp.]|nr:peptidylprolyl isomerase [Candidatus Puniceispirillum sp.]